jgi:hypothetical protein
MTRALLASALLGLAACSGPDKDSDGTPQPTTPTPTPTVVPTPTPGPTTPQPQPTGWQLQATVVTTPSVQLQAAAVDIDVPEGTALHLSWTDGAGHTVEHEPSATGPQQVPILELKPDRTYTLTVTATGPDNLVRDAELSFDSEPVPGHFPDVELVVPSSESFFTLLGSRGNGNAVPLPNEVVLVVDAAGDLVYWQAYDGRMNDARRVPGGVEVMAGDNYPEIVEVDWLGNVQRGYQSLITDLPANPLLTVVDAPGRFHHDYVAVGDGSWWVLSKTVTPVAAYPTDYQLSGTAPTDNAEGVVHRFAADGSTVDTLYLGDVLPMERIAFDSLEPTSVENRADWSHENAVSIHPDGDLLISMRHQDAILKVDPDTQQIDWILGNHDNWPASHQPYLLTPVGDLQWPFHQHAVSVRADGTILMFDNGNFRESPGPGVQADHEGTFYSRVVAYEVDPIARTVEQVVDLRPEPSVFAMAVGDADELPNGHLVGHFGMIVRQDSFLNETMGLGDAAIRVVEWNAAGDEVWHIHLSTARSTVSQGWTSYRSERFDSFYQ